MEETKIIYHIDDEEMPYLVKLPIAPDRVTLADFKKVLFRTNYKFFFKSMDEEFRVVKEEIVNDESKLPCFNGRVVSWLISANGSTLSDTNSQCIDSVVHSDMCLPMERTGGIGDSRPPIQFVKEEIDNDELKLPCFNGPVISSVVSAYGSTLSESNSQCADSVVHSDMCLPMERTGGNGDSRTPSFQVVKEEIVNDESKLPCINGRYVSLIVLADGSTLPDSNSQCADSVVHSDMCLPMERTGGNGDSQPPSFQDVKEEVDNDELKLPCFNDLDFSSIVSADGSTLSVTNSQCADSVVRSDICLPMERTGGNGDSRTPSFQAVKEEIDNDELKLPCFNGPVIFSIVSADGSTLSVTNSQCADSVVHSGICLPMERTGGNGDSQPPSFHANAPQDSRTNLEEPICTETESAISSIIGRIKKKEKKRLYIEKLKIKKEKRKRKKILITVDRLENTHLNNKISYGRRSNIGIFRYFPSNMRFHYHSKTLKNKIKTCKQIKKRASLVVRSIQSKENQIEVSEYCQNSKYSTKEPIISIPGLDRILNSSFAKSRKCLWSLIIIACAVACGYQIVSCFYEYINGDPAIDVYYEDFSKPPCPEILFCPADLTARNVRTEALQKRYRELYNHEGEVYFSDFLKIPNVTSDSLWDLYGLNPADIFLDARCSAWKNDDSCIFKNKPVMKSVKTSSGTCVSVKFNNDVTFIGPITSFRISYPPLPPNWLQLHWYARVLYIPLDGNPKYHEIQDGIPVKNWFSFTAAAKLQKIINLNLPNKPCFESRIIEDCVDRCIEKQLYSLLTCRLPYLNHSLPECKTPESFNQSLTKARKILNQRTRCIKGCPRKCEEYIFLPSADFPPSETQAGFIEILIYANRIQIIKEFRWYTLAGLFSDIGGSLGTFLGFCVLNFIEIIDVLIYKAQLISRRMKSRNSKIPTPNILKRKYVSKATNKITVVEINRRRMNRNAEISNIGRNMKLPKPTSSKLTVQNIRRRKKTDQESSIPISITGFDRILSTTIGWSRRLLWLFFLVLTSAISFYQIFSTVYDFIHSFPEMKIDYERNISIKFPTFTFCPVQPFQYSHDIMNYKAQYISEFNKTDMNISDVNLSDLAQLPEFNITKLWERTRSKKLSTAIVKMQNVLGMKTFDNYKPLIQTYKETLFGTCLSVNAPEMILYEGFATNLFYWIGLDYDTDSSTKFQLFIHDETDEVFLLDPVLRRNVDSGATNVILELTKIKRLHHSKRPCAEKSEVIACNIECFNSMLKEKSVNCSLPFMRRFKYPLCSSAEEFNHSMEVSRMVHQTFMNGSRCGCPVPLEEYIYSADFGDYPNKKLIPDKTALYLIYFKSNSWFVLQDYYKLNYNTVFANICGSLGLYLGVCIPSLMEIMEYCFFNISRKKN